MPGCIVSATTASFCSVVKRRRRATPVITSTFEKVSDIGVYPGLCLGPPAKAGVRSKRGALQELWRQISTRRGLKLDAEADHRSVDQHVELVARQVLALGVIR